MQQNDILNCFISERSECMSTSLVQTEEEFIKTYEKYVNMVYRICFLYLKNESDTEDIVQNVFLKLFTLNQTFHSEQHLKAWLIVTASNACKNQLKHWWKRNVLFEEYDIACHEHQDETLEVLLSLPKKYKIVLYCYYYEGYHTNEIADMLHMNEATVRSHLSRGRNYLRQLLEGGNHEE